MQRLQPSNSNSTSPFDTIRGFRENGTEFWTARELMRFLGFSKWQKFEQVVLDAVADIELLNTGSSIRHITQTGKSPQNGGRDLIDYDLSRLGCYHVALACKQRTIEVAAARRYFVARTHEAELAQQQPLSQMQMISVMALQIDEQNKQIELIKAQQALEATRIDELAQLTHQHDSEIDRIFNPNGHYFSVMGYARNRGIQIGIESAKAIGKKCSIYCKANNIAIEKLTDPRFGSVGSYPEDAIAQFI